jgi:zinc protease
MPRHTPALILGTLSLALALGVAAKPAKPAKPSIAPKAAQPAPAAAAPAAATPASAAASAAQPVPAPLPEPQAVRELEGIQEYRLANGLQVLLFPDPAATTSLTNIVYRVGSRHEGAGEAGMAHLLEHLLFKGVPSVADIPKAMSERGVRFNATTSNDRTHYFSAFNAGSDTLDFVLRLESERMQQSRVEAEDLAKEMPVVMNELQQGENNPGQLLRQRLMAAAYRFHPYGRPTIGTRSDVENVPIEALRRFYQAHYRPDNATLIVAGQFDAPATLARINALFGPLQNPAAAKPLSYTVEPPQDGERSVVVRRVGGQQTLLLAYHVPPFAHPDCAALNLLGQMLAQPPSGPLHKRFVEDEKLAAGVGAGGCGGHDPGLFNVFAVPAAGVPMEKLALPLIAAVEKREGVALSTEQFERMRNQFALGYSQLLKQPQRLAQLLTEAVAAGDWRLVFKLRRDVAALTLEDVQRVARSYLTPNNRTLARYEPAQESGAVSVPTVADRSADLDSLASQQVSAGEQLDPAPAQLAAPHPVADPAQERHQAGPAAQAQPRRTGGGRAAPALGRGRGAARRARGGFHRPPGRRGHGRHRPSALHRRVGASEGWLQRQRRQPGPDAAPGGRARGLRRTAAPGLPGAEGAAPAD